MKSDVHSPPETALKIHENEHTSEPLPGLDGGGIFHNSTLDPCRKGNGEGVEGQGLGKCRPQIVVFSRPSITFPTRIAELEAIVCVVERRREMAAFIDF
ncbi:hypothetical protein GN956_G23748 [Arapaima gigas]